MLSLAARACPVFPCGRTQPCPEHGPKEQDRRRGTSSSRGYGARWRGYRAWFLKRWGTCGARPASAPQTTDSVCAREGLVVQATVVDHIVPVDGPDDPTFYQTSNHQGLCERCHNLKRERESRPGRGAA